MRRQSETAASAAAETERFMEGNEMKYCAECKKVFFTDSERCECGKKFKKFDTDVPVELIAVTGEKKADVERCLVKAEIPYSEIDLAGYTPAIGKVGSGYSYLIPLAFLKKGIIALEDGGLMNRPEWFEQLDLPDDPEWKEMSPAKRAAVKAASIMVFLLLIFLCVAGVDFIAGLIGGLLS